MLTNEFTEKFSPGRRVATPGVLRAVSQRDLLTAFQRHLCGDWGDLSEADKQLNEQALQDGSRLFSAYQSSKDVRFWIITEADRSCTTMLLPSEY